MRVFLDTNVLASALGTRGICWDLLREVLVRHTLLTSDEVLDELRRSLTRKFHVPPSVADESMREVFQDSERFSSRPLLEIASLDAADLAIVSAACNGHADLLVTGDRGVRNVRKTGTLSILTPREFWERLRGESAGSRHGR